MKKNRKIFKICHWIYLLKSIYFTNFEIFSLIFDDFNIQ